MSVSRIKAEITKTGLRAPFEIQSAYEAFCEKFQYAEVIEASYAQGLATGVYFVTKDGLTHRLSVTMSGGFILGHTISDKTGRPLTAGEEAQWMRAYGDKKTLHLICMAREEFSKIYSKAVITSSLHDVVGGIFLYLDTEGGYRHALIVDEQKPFYRVHNIFLDEKELTREEAEAWREINMREQRPRGRPRLESLSDMPVDTCYRPSEKAREGRAGKKTEKEKMEKKAVNLPAPKKVPEKPKPAMRAKAKNIKPAKERTPAKKNWPKERPIVAPTARYKLMGTDMERILRVYDRLAADSDNENDLFQRISELTGIPQAPVGRFLKRYLQEE